jgi:hypothetical protein
MDWISGLLGIFGKVLDLLPSIFAYKAGKSEGEAKAEVNNAKVEKTIVTNNLEDRAKGDIAAQKVEDETRDTSVGDYIRKNDI